MHPQRSGGFYVDPGGVIAVNPVKAVVISLKGGRESQQYQPFRDISHGADINDSVPGVGVGSEFKSSPLKLMNHYRHK